MPVSVCAPSFNLEVQKSPLSYDQQLAWQQQKMTFPSIVTNVTSTHGISFPTKAKTSDQKNHDSHQSSPCGLKSELSNDEEKLSKELEDIFTLGSEKEGLKKSSSRELHSPLSTPVIQIQTPSKFESSSPNAIDEDHFRSFFEFPEYTCNQDKVTSDLSNENKALLDTEARLQASERPIINQKYIAQASNDSGFMESEDSENESIDLYCYEEMPDSPEEVTAQNLLLENSILPVLPQASISKNEKNRT